MKTIIARFCTKSLLILSLIFGGALLAISASTPVSAVDEPPTTVVPTDSETDPDDAPIVTSPTEEGTNTSEEENPADESSDDDSTSAEEELTTNSTDACKEQTGALSWMICPGSGVIARAADFLYASISQMLEISPISMDSSSPVYVVWQYARNITNIVFVIFLLIVIYSQLTGLGLNNYGIKRVLPRLIIAVLLVNLSFIICSLAVDVSNIIGNSLRGFFESIQDTVISASKVSETISSFSLSSFLATIVGGGTIAGVVISAIGGGGYIFFMFLIVLLSAIIAIISGLITISARQALVALLIMIAPLAFVAYLLPNTEKWFAKWKDLFFRMLVFYPMFSFLFGASQLVGYALIVSANSEFGLILGVGVQIFPLFFSWSLMKMSGTVLNNLNSGLRRIASPLQKGFAGWSISRAEQQRQHHIANSSMGGARLRRYLDTRKTLRELDTANSLEIRNNRATESAYRIASSSLGHDKDGNLIWENRANRYTLNAKRAKLASTRGTAAQALYNNTLSGYGDFFKDHSVESKRVALAHGEAFQDAMAQQFLAKNLAQADQDWLLSKVFEAGNMRSDGNSYQYNRLVRSANGTLAGSLGEISVLGQVIAESAAIENRRRTDARIVLTKFPYDKAQFRAMMLDVFAIDDDGYALNSKNEKVEDQHYRLKEGYKYEEYPYYFAVHKETGIRIEKDEYNNLSDADRDEYRKVRYMELKDDSGNFRQLVTSDDAGYIKEMLVDNVSIADPINRRYATELGAARNGATEGILRRYQSTVISTLHNSRYKDHNAAMTSMLEAHLAQGTIHSSGQLHLAELQSLNVAAKNGPVLINDAYVLDNWRDLITSINDDETFSQFITDEDIMGYEDINKKKLKGLVLTYDDNGDLTWQEISREDVEQMDEEHALRARKDYVKHQIIAKTANRLFTAMNRDLSPGVLEDQKPATLIALDKLLDTVIQAGVKNLDPNTPFEEKLRGHEKDYVFATPDPKILHNKASAAQDVQRLMEMASQEGVNVNFDNAQDVFAVKANIQAALKKKLGNQPQIESDKSTESPNAILASILKKLESAATFDEAYRKRNSFLTIQDAVTNGARFSPTISDFKEHLFDYFKDTESLNTLTADLETLMQEEELAHTNINMSIDESLKNIPNSEQIQRERIDAFRDKVIDFIKGHAQTT